MPTFEISFTINTDCDPVSISEVILRQLKEFSSQRIPGWDGTSEGGPSVEVQRVSIEHIGEIPWLEVSDE